LKILFPYGAETVEALQNALGDKVVVVKSERTAESMLEKGNDAVIVVSGRVPGDYIRNAKSLKMIQALGAGIDKIDRQAVLDRGDLIVCNNHMNAFEVAEYAIMLLLSAAKNIIVNDRELRKGDWTYGFGGPRPNVEIRNKTCLLLGLGNIGIAIAERLKGFGTRIAAATRSGVNRNPELVDTVVSFEEMKSIVSESDFIVLALPLTHESRSLVNEEFISWMKSSSILVNISRGEIIDESALYKALKEERILGAALDVWWKYPQWGEGAENFPPSNFPFHELDNVVISPHRAAYSLNVRQAHFEFIVENLKRFIQGKEPKNIVNMELGY
jgi:phosphoglycerate dehydrogenase-like enzyme